MFIENGLKLSFGGISNGRENFSCITVYAEPPPSPSQ